MADAPKTVSEDELALAFSGPATFANKFYVTLMGPVARIAFTEQRSAGKLPEFRGAVAMALPDLIELQTTIQNLLSNVQVITIPQKKDNA